MTIIEAIDQLNTVESLREFFKKEGIRGIPTNPERCPVAEYLSKVTEEPVSVGHIWIHTQGARVDVSERLANFINEFDQGFFPEIVK
jgi:hypothetical protein